MLKKFIVIFLLAALSIPESSFAYKLFGFRESKSARLTPFPKWTDVLKRYEGEVTADASSCDVGSRACQMAKLNKFLGSIRGKSEAEQIEAVNRYLNETKYIIDPINWGVPDYWATPYQFHVKDGDCEDYAISKYYSLRALGFSNEDLRIVVLNDNNLRVAHSVLAVYSGGRIYILDNQIKQVIEDKDIHHYEPIYSINEKTWWRHMR